MIPEARQRVRVKGLDGVFLVIGVDHASGCAIVNRAGGSSETVTVPFDQIEPETGFGGGAPQRIMRPRD